METPSTFEGVGGYGMWILLVLALDKGIERLQIASHVLPFLQTEKLTTGFKSTLHTRDIVILVTAAQSFV